MDHKVSNSKYKDVQIILYKDIQYKEHCSIISKKMSPEQLNKPMSELMALKTYDRNLNVSSFSKT